MYSHIISDASYSEIIELMADRLLKIKSRRNRQSERTVESNIQSANSNNQRAGSKEQMGNELSSAGSNATPPGGAAHANKKTRVKNVSRYISVATKRLAYQEAQGSCSFVDLKTNRKCSSRFQLEYDHKYPFSLGGESTPENIRLLCRRHNQFYAHKFGLLF